VEFGGVERLVRGSELDVSHFEAFVLLVLGEEGRREEEDAAG
jgi:hypothetical protein